MQTLGDVITALIILAALIVVPYKLAKAWLWPYVKPLIMSRFEHATVRTSREPAEPIAVFADTHHLELEEPGENEPAPEPIRLRQLPRADLIILLAVQRKEEGGYLFSANQITAFVGGTAAPVKALIAEIRAEKQAEPLPPGRIDRPASGWRVKAS
jgi:hypothetical protein